MTQEIRDYNKEAIQSTFEELKNEYNAFNKSPYSNSFYTNPDKDWDGDVNDGIRISDHWNFGYDFSAKYGMFKTHCETDINARQLHDYQHIAVGKYCEEQRIYEIIKIIWFIETACVV